MKAIGALQECCSKKFTYCRYVLKFNESRMKTAPRNLIEIIEQAESAFFGSATKKIEQRMYMNRKKKFFRLYTTITF